MDPLPLVFKTHRLAKRIKLRFDAQKQCGVLTLPPGVSEKKARKFAEEHQQWLQDQRCKTPPALRLNDGQIIPYRGQDCRIIHQPEKPARVVFQQDELLVGGPSQGLGMRIMNALKKHARVRIEESVFRLAPQVGAEPKRIQIRDTKSRWGSCSSSRNISFSWRLILAPPEILDYVVAHELAHLIEMNHSEDFWHIVERVIPHWKISRRWLKTHGTELMMIRTD